MARKRTLLSSVLILCLALALCAQAFAASALVSDQKLSIDGKAVPARAYNIDGSNYFKLRDLAYLLSGTASQFSVDYDAAENRIRLVTGAAYSPVGGELAELPAGTREAVDSPQSLLLNGEAVTSLKAYNIGGNNYFKLRDLGAALGFAVDYDEQTRTMLVTTASVPDPEKTLTVGGTDYWLGMSEAELTAAAGQPDETLMSSVGWTWYVFGTGDYAERFFLAGAAEGKVVSLCSEGPAFSFRGLTCASRGSLAEETQGCASLYYDKNNGYRLHLALLTDPAYALQMKTGAAQLAGESRVVFHLVNAFRSGYDLPALQWDERAEKSARLHSTDMAIEGYYSHTSLDGRSPFDRMAAQGISFTAAGENIGYEYGYTHSCGVAFHCGWVDSAGHRENLLDRDYRYLGVGGASLTGRVFFTQNFFG